MVIASSDYDASIFIAHLRRFPREIHSIPPENSTAVFDAPRKFLVRCRIELEIVERVVGAGFPWLAPINQSCGS
jgi:hypothetical protein